MTSDKRGRKRWGASGLALSLAWLGFAFAFPMDIDFGDRQWGLAIMFGN